MKLNVERKIFYTFFGAILAIILAMSIWFLISKIDEYSRPQADAQFYKIIE